MLKRFTGKKIMALMMVAGSLYMTGCSKSLEAPVSAPQELEAITGTPQLIASRSVLELLEGNEKNLAVDFNWGPYNPNGFDEKYTLEAAVAGTSFADPVVLGSTEQTKIALSVAGFNNQLRRILIAGVQSRVEFRVKISGPQLPSAYSKPVAIDIITYHPYKNINSLESIRIPGNYQGWKIAGAPQIVPVSENEYEGYIDFTDENTEFMMIKGTDRWESLRTFSDIGAGKYGFGGKVFMPKEGAGIYRLYANSNTNTWTLTKIKCWGLSGSAVNGNPQLAYDKKTKTWSADIMCNAGEFVFSANNENKIVLGNDAESGVGVLSSNEYGKIRVNTAGKYRVMISVLEAGNYQYGIQRLQ